MNYPQLVRSLAKQPVRLFWLQGGEAVLVEDAIDEIRRAVEPKVFSSFTASDELEAAWAEIARLPSGLRNLMLLRGGESVGDWSPLQEWVAERVPDSYVVVESADDPPDMVRVAVKRRAAVVLKASLTVAAKEDYCQTVLPDLDRFLLRYLLELTGGDVYELRNCLHKLKLLNRPLSEGLIRVVAEAGTSETDFVLSLVKMQKVRALKALERIPPLLYGSILNLLDHNLDALYRINSGLVRGMNSRAIHTTTMLKPYLIQMLLPAAKFYDRTKTRACARTLAVVDDRLKRGDLAGVMEMLVMLW